MDNHSIQPGKEGAFAAPRRDVLVSGMAAAFLSSLGIVPLARAQRSREVESDRVLTTIPDGPDSLNIAGPTLTTYAPPEAAIRDFPRWLARFDLFLWEARNKNMNAKNFRTTNTVMGEMLVAGDPASGVYQVSEKRTVAGLATVFDLRLQCEPGPLPRIRSWSVAHRAAPYGGSVLAEKAEIKNGRVEWTSAPAGRSGAALPSGGLLAAGVVFALAGQLPDLPSFGLLHEGVHLLAPETFERNAAPLEVRLASGRQATWTAAALHGFGIMPTHLFVDERGQSLLVTQGMNGYSLRTVAAWDGMEVAL